MTGRASFATLDRNAVAYYVPWRVRPYIVIPEGTPVIRVDASTPHFAASKAQKGKGERAAWSEPSVLPASSLVGIDGGPREIPGQLAFEHGHG